VLKEYRVFEKKIMAAILTLIKYPFIKIVSLWQMITSALIAKLYQGQKIA
jgi:hypothetical protein